MLRPAEETPRGQTFPEEEGARREPWDSPAPPPPGAIRLGCDRGIWLVGGGGGRVNMASILNSRVDTVTYQSDHADASAHDAFTGPIDGPIDDTIGNLYSFLKPILSSAVPTTISTCLDTS